MKTAEGALGFPKAKGNQEFPTEDREFTDEIRKMRMKFPIYRVTWMLAGVLFPVVLALPAFAAENHDRTQLGHSITIGPDEEVGEATCFGCSIRVRGHVNGDVTAFGGKIFVEEGGQINGDATVFGGDLRLNPEAHVGGDVTVFGGRIYRDASSSVGGDVTNFGGFGWMLLIFLAPFVLLGLFITLIVWLIRRLMRPSVPAAA